MPSHGMNGVMERSIEFIPVAETTLPGGLVVPAFEVSRYQCGIEIGGELVSGVAKGASWLNPTFSEAKHAAAAAGYTLMKESQWLALAYQITATPTNWISGKVGVGRMYQGARHGNSSISERKYHTLPSGEKVYQLLAREGHWVFDDIQGDKEGLIASPFKKDSPSIVIPFPAENKGQGMSPSPGANGVGNAIVRGGTWSSSSGSMGLFRLQYGWPYKGTSAVGFRCTRGSVQ